jgi:hypothetical protein
MTVSDPGTELHPRRNDSDLPVLRAGLAWFTTVALCIVAALGISAIIGASLSRTAVQIAGSGAVCGLYGLLAVGSSTLRQRSRGWQLTGAAGVLAAAIATVLALVGIWGSSPLGEAVVRILACATLAATAIGFTAFLLTQQREEDPPAIRRLMIGTATIFCALALVLIIEFAFSGGSVSTSNTPASSDSQFVFSGITFARFVGVTFVLSVLGALLLPVLRRAHPAYRGGPNSPA